MPDPNAYGNAQWLQQLMAMLQQGQQGPPNTGAFPPSPLGVNPADLPSPDAQNTGLTFSGNALPPGVTGAPLAKTAFPIPPGNNAPATGYGGPTAAADAARAPNYGPAASQMPFPGQIDPQGFWGPTLTQRNNAAPPSLTQPRTSTGPRPQAPNLGYYVGATPAAARGRATAVQYTDPNDPRIYKGPLSLYGRS